MELTSSWPTQTPAPTRTRAPNTTQTPTTTPTPTLASGFTIELANPYPNLDLNPKHLASGLNIELANPHPNPDNFVCNPTHQTRPCFWNNLPSAIQPPNPTLNPARTPTPCEWSRDRVGHAEEEDPQNVALFDVAEVSPCMHDEHHLVGRPRHTQDFLLVLRCERRPSGRASTTRTRLLISAPLWASTTR